jgi:integrase
MVNGKRERRQFPTRDEAETYAQQVRIAWENEGQAGFNLAPSQKAEAEHCFLLLEGKGGSLTEAVRFYLEHLNRQTESRRVADIVAHLLQEKANSNLREATLRTVNGFLGTFSRTFGDSLLTALELGQLTAVCSDPGFLKGGRGKGLQRLKPKTVRNRIGMLTDLYNHAIRNNWAQDNLASRIQKPAKEQVEPGVLLVDQARSLLCHANRFGLLPYIALGLFVGIRRTELTKLDWTAVKIQDGEVIIGANIAKMRSRRVIPINETLAAWLAICHQESGPIVDAKHFDRNFRLLKKAAGITKWPHNALRHSFASYHLAAIKAPVRTA